MKFSFGNKVREQGLQGLTLKEVWIQIKARNLSQCYKYLEYCALIEIKWYSVTASSSVNPTKRE